VALVLRVLTALALPAAAVYCMLQAMQLTDNQKAALKICWDKVSCRALLACLTTAG
jgi:hypothetical protein